MVSKLIVVFLFGASIVYSAPAPEPAPYKISVLPSLYPRLVMEPEPCLTEIVKPEMDFQPLVVPLPPKLPPFVMPELPIPVIEPPKIVAPCPEDEPVALVAIPKYTAPLIPAPPVLPPAVLPELPVRFEVPSAPAPIIFEKPLAEPCITEELVISAPVIIPEPPKLPEPVQVVFEQPAPMPIYPAFPAPAVAFADPCDTPLQPVLKFADLPPYYGKNGPSPVSVTNKKVIESGNVIIPASTYARGGYRFINEKALSLPKHFF